MKSKTDRFKKEFAMLQQREISSKYLNMIAESVRAFFKKFLYIKMSKKHDFISADFYLQIFESNNIFLTRKRLRFSDIYYGRLVLIIKWTSIWFWFS